MATRTSSTEVSAEPEANGLTNSWRVCHAARADQYVIPAGVAESYGAVAVGSEGETLLLAVSDPDPVKARQVASAVRRPVRLIAAGPSEISRALARGSSRDELSLRLRSLLDLVADLGLDHVLPDGEREALMAAKDVAALNARVASLPDAWGQELLGLLDGLPHLAAAAAHFHPSLQLLLPPDLRRLDTLAVWGVEGDWLILASPELPSDEVLRAVSAWSGYKVRCGLVGPGVIRQQLVVDEAGGRSGRTSSPESRGFNRRGGRREREDERRARIVARQRGERLEEVERRLGVSPHRSHRPKLQPEIGALSLFPPALLRSLRFMPVRLDGNGLEVALPPGRQDRTLILDLLQKLIGLPVRARQETETDVALCLSHLSDRRVTGASTDLGPQWAGALLQTAQSGAARCTALSLLHTVPWVRLEHYRLDPDALCAVPPEDMQRLQVVPVRRDGEVLWVATHEPTADLIGQLENLTGLSVRPLLADQVCIADWVTSLGSAAQPAATQERIGRHPVLTWLQAEGVVTKNDLLHLLADPSLPVDAALDAAGVLPFPRFSETAARLAGVPLIDLRLRPRPEEIVDALGRRTRREVWTDPVDAEVARTLQPDAVQQSGVLPVRRENGVLVVAVADPFDAATRGLLEALDHQNVQLAVAPRPAIMSALARSRGSIPLGDRLLAHGIVSPPELARALDLHRKTGVRLGRALLTLGMVTQEQLAHVLSEQRDLPFFRLGGLRPDPVTVGLLSEETERRLGVVPLYRTGDELTVATPDPLNQAALDEVAARTGLKVLPVICTEGDFEAMLETLYRDQYLERSTSELVSRAPEESASRVLNTGQRAVLIIAALTFLLGLVRSPGTVGLVLTAAASGFYVAFSVYRSYLIYRALSHNLEVPVSDEEVAELDDATLPIYTILVPLYREASVLPTLILGLSKLDYPATKLDVKLLLEEDDVETRSAVDVMLLPDYVRPVVVPAAPPRCKPKACNYGLIHAQGEYVVIYDAEDVPDPDQLKKAVVAFRKSDPDVTCLQAKLNYYNSKQNLLTSWFTTEYSMWFDLFLPGLDAAQVPIPLGGTSNHFPTAVLREVGAWDPYNVTEDADLGVRLFRRGYKTAILNSTTLEEANSEVYNWIRQRSRWVKGYIQTYLVHMRHPITLWRALGTKAFFSFNMVVGGTFACFLLNPVFWSLTALWYMAHAGFIRTLYPGPVYYFGMASLVVGNFAFVYLNVAGCLRRGHYGMVKHALLTPLYWGLMSLAAWKGFIQLWTNPFYWEKTAHGLYRRPHVSVHPDQAES